MGIDLDEEYKVNVNDLLNCWVFYFYLDSVNVKFNFINSIKFWQLIIKNNQINLEEVRESDNLNCLHSLSTSRDSVSRTGLQVYRVHQGREAWC